METEIVEALLRINKSIIITGMFIGVGLMLWIIKNFDSNS